jgi:hypothetical protein
VDRSRRPATIADKTVRIVSVHGDGNAQLEMRGAALRAWRVVGVEKKQPTTCNSTRLNPTQPNSRNALGLIQLRAVTKLLSNHLRGPRADSCYTFFFLSQASLRAVMSCCAAQIRGAAAVLRVQGISSPRLRGRGAESYVARRRAGASICAMAVIATVLILIIIILMITIALNEHGLRTRAAHGGHTARVPGREDVRSEAVVMLMICFYACIGF